MQSTTAQFQKTKERRLDEAPKAKKKNSRHQVSQALVPPDQTRHIAVAVSQLVLTSFGDEVFGDTKSATGRNEQAIDPSSEKRFLFKCLREQLNSNLSGEAGIALSLAAHIGEILINIDERSISASRWRPINEDLQNKLQILIDNFGTIKNKMPDYLQCGPEGWRATFWVRQLKHNLLQLKRTPHLTAQIILWKTEICRCVEHLANYMNQMSMLAEAILENKKNEKDLEDKMIKQSLDGFKQDRDHYVGKAKAVTKAAGQGIKKVTLAIDSRLDASGFYQESGIEFPLTLIERLEKLSPTLNRFLVIVFHIITQQDPKHEFFFSVIEDAEVKTGKREVLGGLVQTEQKIIPPYSSQVKFDLLVILYHTLRQFNFPSKFYHDMIEAMLARYQPAEAYFDREQRACLQSLGAQYTEHRRWLLAEPQLLARRWEVFLNAKNLFEILKTLPKRQVWIMVRAKESEALPNDEQGWLAKLTQAVQRDKQIKQKMQQCLIKLPLQLQKQIYHKFNLHPQALAQRVIELQDAIDQLEEKYKLKDPKRGKQGGADIKASPGAGGSSRGGPGRSELLGRGVVAPEQRTLDDLQQELDVIVGAINATADFFYLLDKDQALLACQAQIEQLESATQEFSTRAAATAAVKPLHQEPDKNQQLQLVPHDLADRKQAAEDEEEGWVAVDETKVLSAVRPEHFMFTADSLAGRLRKKIIDDSKEKAKNGAAVFFEFLAQLNLFALPILAPLKEEIRSLNFFDTNNIARSKDKIFKKVTAQLPFPKTQRPLHDLFVGLIQSPEFWHAVDLSHALVRIYPIGDALLLVGDTLSRFQANALFKQDIFCFIDDELILNAFIYFLLLGYLNEALIGKLNTGVGIEGNEPLRDALGYAVSDQQLENKLQRIDEGKKQNGNQQIRKLKKQILQGLLGYLTKTLPSCQALDQELAARYAEQVTEKMVDVFNIDFLFLFLKHLKLDVISSGAAVDIVSIPITQRGRLISEAVAEASKELMKLAKKSEEKASTRKICINQNPAYQYIVKEVKGGITTDNLLLVVQDQIWFAYNQEGQYELAGNWIWRNQQAMQGLVKRLSSDKTQLSAEEKYQLVRTAIITHLKISADDGLPGDLFYETKLGPKYPAILAVDNNFSSFADQHALPIIATTFGVHIVEIDLASAEQDYNVTSLNFISASMAQSGVTCPLLILGYDLSNHCYYSLIPQKDTLSIMNLVQAKQRRPLPLSKLESDEDIAEMSDLDDGHDDPDELKIDVVAAVTTMPPHLLPLSSEAALAQAQQLSLRSSAIPSKQKEEKREALSDGTRAMQPSFSTKKLTPPLVRTKTRAKLFVLDAGDPPYQALALTARMGDYQTFLNVLIRYDLIIRFTNTYSAVTALSAFMRGNDGQQERNLLQVMRAKATASELNPGQTIIYRIVEDTLTQHASFLQQPVLERIYKSEVLLTVALLEAILQNIVEDDEADRFFSLCIDSKCIHQHKVNKKVLLAAFLHCLQMKNTTGGFSLLHEKKPRILRVIAKDMLLFQQIVARDAELTTFFQQGIYEFNIEETKRLAGPLTLVPYSELIMMTCNPTEEEKSFIKQQLALRVPPARSFDFDLDEPMSLPLTGSTVKAQEAGAVLAEEMEPEPTLSSSVSIVLRESPEKTLQINLEKVICRALVVFCTAFYDVFHQIDTTDLSFEFFEPHRGVIALLCAKRRMSDYISENSKPFIDEYLWEGYAKGVDEKYVAIDDANKDKLLQRIFKLGSMLVLVLDGQAITLTNEQFIKASIQEEMRSADEGKVDASDATRKTVKVMLATFQGLEVEDFASIKSLKVKAITHYKHNKKLPTFLKLQITEANQFIIKLILLKALAETLQPASIEPKLLSQILNGVITEASPVALATKGTFAFLLANKFNSFADPFGIYQFIQSLFTEAEPSGQLDTNAYESRKIRFYFKFAKYLLLSIEDIIRIPGVISRYSKQHDIDFLARVQGVKKDQPEALRQISDKQAHVMKVFPFDEVLINLIKQFSKTADELSEILSVAAFLSSVSLPSDLRSIILDYYLSGSQLLTFKRLNRYHAATQELALQLAHNTPYLNFRILWLVFADESITKISARELVYFINVIIMAQFIDPDSEQPIFLPDLPTLQENMVELYVPTSGTAHAQTVADALGLELKEVKQAGGRKDQSSLSKPSLLEFLGPKHSLQRNAKLIVFLQNKTKLDFVAKLTEQMKSETLLLDDLLQIPAVMMQTAATTQQKKDDEKSVTSTLPFFDFGLTSQAVNILTALGKKEALPYKKFLKLIDAVLRQLLAWVTELHAPDLYAQITGNLVLRWIKAILCKASATEGSVDRPTLQGITSFLTDDQKTFLYELCALLLANAELIADKVLPHELSQRWQDDPTVSRILQPWVREDNECDECMQQFFEELAHDMGALRGLIGLSAEQNRQIKALDAKQHNSVSSSLLGKLDPAANHPLVREMVKRSIQHRGRRGQIKFRSFCERYVNTLQRLEPPAAKEFWQQASVCSLFKHGMLVVSKEQRADREDWQIDEEKLTRITSLKQNILQLGLTASVSINEEKYELSEFLKLQEKHSKHETISLDDWLRILLCIRQSNNALAHLEHKVKVAGAFYSYVTAERKEATPASPIHIHIIRKSAGHIKIVMSREVDLEFRPRSSLNPDKSAKLVKIRYLSLRYKWNSKDNILLNGKELVASKVPENNILTSTFIKHHEQLGIFAANWLPPILRAYREICAIKLADEAILFSDKDSLPQTQALLIGYFCHALTEFAKSKSPERYLIELFSEPKNKRNPLGCILEHFFKIDRKKFLQADASRLDGVDRELVNLLPAFLSILQMIGEVNEELASLQRIAAEGDSHNFEQQDDAKTRTRRATKLPAVQSVTAKRSLVAALSMTHEMLEYEQQGVELQGGRMGDDVEEQEEKDLADGQLSREDEPLLRDKPEPASSELSRTYSMSGPSLFVLSPAPRSPAKSGSETAQLLRPPGPGGSESDSDG